MAMSCLDSLPAVDHALFITTCWAIWNARNRWIYEGEQCDPKKSMEHVKKVIGELAKDEVGASSGGSRGQQSWKPPSAGRLKLNVDGGVREGLGSSVGVVLRDANGVVVLAASWMFEDRWEPSIVEAKAILLGVQAAADFGARNIEVESDCLGVLNAIKAQVRGDSSLHLIFDDIYHEIRSFDFVSWSFTHREGNKVAHELAHCFPWEPGSRVWLSNFPSCIVPLLDFDLPTNE
ncbi:uncharacterized protein LOC110713786 [Chenopodium quinoa]|uniref:uncharacterized protein LOC110713786 n=1 Tax=Chenopodium quinoa TaxID=63459 RepID=UPI000B781484|nr:uncharacterized protein LOC110713786 [Chenopodium quinoa]